MGQNTEWKQFFDGLSPQELSVVCKLQTKHQDVVRGIAKKSLEVAPVDFSFDDYVDLMGYLVERIVNDSESYKPRVESYGNYQEEGTTLLHVEDIVGYFLRFHATHKVTTDLDFEKRESILTSRQDQHDPYSLLDPWTNIQIIVDREIYDYRGEARGVTTDYVHDLDLNEIARICKCEGVPQDILRRIVEESSRVMRARNIHLGGGEGNTVIRVVYTLGKKLPEELIAKLKPEDATMISADPLTTNDYALVCLRQNMKGMGSHPYLSDHTQEDLAALLK